jgi:hypothetical protein
MTFLGLAAAKDAVIAEGSVIAPPTTTANAPASNASAT